MRNERESHKHRMKARESLSLTEPTDRPDLTTVMLRSAPQRTSICQNWRFVSTFDRRIDSKVAFETFYVLVTIEY